MSRKTSPARRAAFLKALRETGNQSIAAERAKVSRSWVQLQRSIDPAFKADVAAAVAAARNALKTDPHPASPAGGRGGRSNRPPAGWAHLSGEELVVRGTNGRRVQVARARLHQWTPRVEDRFLALLGRTCNLRLSLKGVGFSAASLHEHRKRWPAFDERCEQAIRAGYERIDRGLTAGAIRAVDPSLSARERAQPGDPAIAPLTIDDAIRLVRLHEKRALEAARRRMGWPEAGPRWPGRWTEGRLKRPPRDH